MSLSSALRQLFFCNTTTFKSICGISNSSFVEHHFHYLDDLDTPKLLCNVFTSSQDGGIRSDIFTAVTGMPKFYKICLPGIAIKTTF
jgi:hypothetical protein